MRPSPIQPQDIPLPASPPPSPPPLDNHNTTPAIRDDGRNLVVNLPGRFHPRDPKSIRLEAEANQHTSREVDRLLDPNHFEHGRPPPNLSKTRSGIEHARLADEPAHPNTSPLPTSLPPLPSSPMEIERKVATSAMVSLEDALDFAFFSSSTLEPTSLAEARTRPDGEKWIKAAISEISAHLDNGTWELQQLPHGKRAIGSRWVFKVKHNADGSIERYKGRLVAKGYAQQEGVDYTDTFAPTARFGALRAVIALAAKEDLELDSVDISTAFLNGDIDADVYMKIPEGVKIEGAEGHQWVLKLLKGLYGIKQGPRIWSKKLHEVLTKLGFNRLECDHSVFIYDKDNVKVIVPVYVDDLIIASKSREAISSFKSNLAVHFKIRDLGPMTQILGIKLERDRKTRQITLSQATFIDTLLSKYANYTAFNSADTPMTNEPLSEKMCPTTDEEKEKMASVPYREVVGKLLYLSITTRPDISYAVGVLCRYNANPGPKHWAAVKHLLRYLKGTKNYKLYYSSDDTSEPFVTYCDADLGGNVDNSRSTAGYVMKIGGGAVMWGSRLQRHVSLSSTESEYTTASATGCEVMWMRYFFDELGYDMSKPSTLWMDSNSAIQVAKNPEHISTMKHVHRCYNWIRERVEDAQIRVGHIPGSENPADIFTKPLSRVKFQRFRDMLGVRL
jgi:hypothetical protein